MRYGRWFALGLLFFSLCVGTAGCGVDRYGWRFGLGTDAQDGVTTEADVDRVKDGVLPAEPEEPEKKKGKGAAPKAPEEPEKKKGKGAAPKAPEEPKASEEKKPS